MSWDKKTDDWQFSVRTGPAIGKVSENRMIAAMGGQDTIRKRLQNNNDGSTTIAHTRGPGSQPEFITNVVQTGDACSDACSDAYLESGAIDLISTSSTYGSSAIPVWYTGVTLMAGKWLGSISRKLGKVGDSTNNPAVGASQLSKAAPLGSLTKRQIMQKIPASLYTGKMRLYIQSLYGAKNSTVFPLNVVDSGSNAPYLSYRIARGNDYELVYLTGSTGVYTDSEYRFWLVGINSNEIRVALLACDSCTERLRPLLKAASSDAERDKISAYILSQSQPVGSFFSLPITVTTLNQFGYGWHFNWDGSKADIVKVDTVPNGGGVKYVSTHYRITINRAETELMVFPNDSVHWSASIETVETKEWKNLTHTDVISHPDWGENKQYIFNGHGSRFGDNFGDAAPFYCFYNRNDLKVCRYTCSVSASESFHESFPEEYSDNHLHQIFCDFGVQTEDEGTRYSVARRMIDVGELSVSAENYSETSTHTEAELTWDGNIPAEETSYRQTPGTVSSYYFTPNTYPRNPVRVDYTVGPAPASAGYSNRTSVAYREERYARTKTLQGAVLCVIPFYDAEAAYCINTCINHDLKEAVVVSTGSSSQFPSQTSVKAIYVNNNVVALSYGGTIRSSVIPALGNFTTDMQADIDTVTSTVSGKLICGVGEFTIDDSVVNIAAMQQPDDYYSFSQFPEKSSAGKNYKYGFAVDIPTDLVPEGGVPSFVGWA